ncbi:Methanol O-anthraniloyltransferase [Vitis vinifera]|uniref:Methanol O-anthraniloyltransferase n=1 Tax=Vitis vinifera TaxID=29760 RepID=A0A438IZF1_VITVI|nr:Methanol O-anthraniloyltransferase [Vitis vinifera]
MSDSLGLVQFLNAVSEMARGADVPSVLPVLERELLNAQNPPRITCMHHEYEEVHDTRGTLGVMDDHNTVHRSFFFGPKEIKALRKRIPQTLGPCSTFEALTACLPSGYYGNAFANPAAVTKAGELCNNPLGYAVKLVKKAKAEMSEEYIRSVADFMEIDFGWGKPLYGGLAKAMSIISFCLRFRNSKGEEGVVVPICLPLQVMERFGQEVKRMIAEEVASKL